MSRALNPDIDTATSADAISPFILLDLMFDTAPIYLWNGVGELVHEGNAYTGAGTLMQISDVVETADIAAVGMTFSISGIAGDVLSLALAEPYQGRVAKLKLGVFDAAMVPSATVVLFTGIMDQMTITEDGDTCAVAIAVESKMIGIGRPRVRRYTSASQKQRFPGDLAFDFVNDLQDRPLMFGRGS